MARPRDARTTGSGGFQSDPPGGRPAGRPTPRGAAKPSPASRTPAPRRGSQVIPDPVARRMGRRIAVATGVPSLLGTAVIVASYLLVSRGGLSIPPAATLLASGACFLLGLVGLSYGVVSASWEEDPGTVLGWEQIPLNISRIRESVRAMRQGGGA